MCEKEHSCATFSSWIREAFPGQKGRQAKKVHRLNAAVYAERVRVHSESQRSTKSRRIEVDADGNMTCTICKRNQIT
eukprot:4196469-Pyramimonas_sp.AAC.1